MLKYVYGNGSRSGRSIFLGVSFSINIDAVKTHTGTTCVEHEKYKEIYFFVFFVISHKKENINKLILRNS